MKATKIMLSTFLFLLIGCTAVTTPEETAVPSETPNIAPEEVELDVEPVAEPAEEQPMNETPVPEPTPTEDDSKQVSEPVTVDLGNVTPQPIDGTPVVQPAPGNPGLKDPVIQAMTDLSERLGIDMDNIELVSLVDVTWRDGGRGCPEAGIDYIQVLTPGQRMILRVNGQDYHYHSGKGSVFSYCGDPQPPIENIGINPNQPPPPGQDD